MIDTSSANTMAPAAISTAVSVVVDRTVPLPELDDDDDAPTTTGAALGR